MLCPNCNTSESYREYGKEEGEKTIIQIHTCMCGRLKKQTFYQRITQSYWFDGECVFRDYRKEDK